MVKLRVVADARAGRRPPWPDWVKHFTRADPRWLAAGDEAEARRWDRDEPGDVERMVDRYRHRRWAEAKCEWLTDHGYTSADWWEWHYNQPRSPK